MFFWCKSTRKYSIILSGVQQPQVQEDSVGHKFNFEHVSFNRDDIVEMSNDELQKNIIKFKRMIREARTMGQDTGRLEVEYCFWS